MTILKRLTLAPSTLLSEVIRQPAPSVLYDDINQIEEGLGFGEQQFSPPPQSIPVSKRECAGFVSYKAACL